MEIVRFAYDNLKRNPKNAYFFAFSIIVASAVITLFFSILGNPYYGVSSMSDYVTYAIGSADFDGGIGNGIFAMILSLMMISICVITVFFSNKFFLMSKVEDISVMMISGCNVMRLGYFLIVQNFIVLLISAPIGALIGFGFHPLINYLIYKEMAISASLFAFSMDAMVYCVTTLFMVGFWLILVDAGFVYRMDLNTLLKARKSMNPIGKPKSIYFKLFYVIVYVYILYFLCTLDFTHVNFFFMIYVSVGIAVGPANIFKYIYPEAVTWVKNKLFPTDHHRVISTGNLRYSIITSGMLVTIILIDVSILFFYLCKFRHDAATFMVVLLSYIVSLVLICVCIGYKLSSDALNKKLIFHNMISIGYLKSDIKTIILQEMAGFFFLIIITCLPLLFIISLMFVLIETITPLFMIGMLFIFMAMISFAGVVMYRIYVNLIFKEALDKPMVNEE